MDSGRYEEEQSIADEVNNDEIDNVIDEINEENEQMLHELQDEFDGMQADNREVNRFFANNNPNNREEVSDDDEELNALNDEVEKERAREQAIDEELNALEEEIVREREQEQVQPQNEPKVQPQNEQPQEQPKDVPPKVDQNAEEEIEFNPIAEEGAELKADDLIFNPENDVLAADNDANEAENDEIQNDMRSLNESANEQGIPQGFDNMDYTFGPGEQQGMEAAGEQNGLYMMPPASDRDYEQVIEDAGEWHRNQSRTSEMQRQVNAPAQEQGYTVRNGIYDDPMANVQQSGQPEQGYSSRGGIYDNPNAAMPQNAQNRQPQYGPGYQQQYGQPQYGPGYQPQYGQPQYAPGYQQYWQPQYRQPQYVQPQQVQRFRVPINDYIQSTTRRISDLRKEANGLREQARLIQERYRDRPDLLQIAQNELARATQIESIAQYLTNDFNMLNQAVRQVEQQLNIRIGSVDVPQTTMQYIFGQQYAPQNMPQYRQPQYAQPQYVQPQYRQPQYAQQQYAQQQYRQPQYAQQQYRQPQNAQPQNATQQNAQRQNMQQAQQSQNRPQFYAPGELYAEEKGAASRDNKGVDISDFEIIEKEDIELEQDVKQAEKENKENKENKGVSADDFEIMEKEDFVDNSLNESMVTNFDKDDLYDGREIGKDEPKEKNNADIKEAKDKDKKDINGKQNENEDRSVNKKGAVKQDKKLNDFENNLKRAKKAAERNLRKAEESPYRRKARMMLELYKKDPKAYDKKKLDSRVKDLLRKDKEYKLNKDNPQKQQNKEVQKQNQVKNQQKQLKNQQDQLKIK